MTPHRLSAFILLLLVPFLPTTLAQSYHPFSTVTASSACVEGQAIYFLGGSVRASPTTSYLSSQAFMIDLKVSWNASNPAYKILPDGPATQSIGQRALSPDGQNWFIVGNYTGQVYNTLSGLQKIKPIAVGPSGIIPVVDPDTNVVYVPNGYSDPVSSMNSMLMINLTSGASSHRAMDPPLNASYIPYGQWIVSRKSFVFMEQPGSGATNQPVALYNFSPSGGWSIASSDIAYPQPYPAAPCIAPAYGGSKIARFGGWSDTLPFTDIQIFDVATMVWTRGPDIPAKNARGGAACSVSNDYLIIWGGSTFPNGTSLVADMTLVYDMKANVWVSSFIPPALQSNQISSTSAGSTSSSSASTAPGPLLTDSSSSSNTSSRVAVIFGAVAGAFTILFSIGGAVLYWLRIRIAKTNNYFSEKTGRPHGLFTGSDETSFDGSSDHKRNVTEMPSATSIDKPSSGSRNPAYPSSSLPLVTNTYWADISSKDDNSTSRGPTAYVVELHKPLSATAPCNMAIMEAKERAVEKEVIPKKGSVQEGPYGAQRFSLHPHAQVEDSLTTQEIMGIYYEPRPVSQHPHTYCSNEIK